MDLGDVMRELGLDMFASSSVSSSAGTDDDGPDALEDLDEPETPGNPDGPPMDDEPEFEAFDDSDPAPEPESVDDSVAQDEVMSRLDDISHQIDQLASDVEDNTASIRALKSEREEVIERLDRIENNNATLLGVYDRLTNDINPFAADWNEKYDQKISEQDDQPYGVVEPAENEAEARAAAREGEDDNRDAHEEDGLSFDDLKDKHEDGETDEESTTSGADSSAPDPDESDATEAETHSPPADPDPDPAETARTSNPATAGAVPPRPGVGNGDEPYLDSLASTFATEVLMMEWLSMLIDVAGPAGAMKALDFYERINWISPEIKRRLENVLSGAHDTAALPSRPPSDLTAEEHNRSFAHIMRLAQQQGFAQTRRE